jgi:hypothetical protein
MDDSLTQSCPLILKFSRFLLTKIADFSNFSLKFRGFIVAKTTKMNFRLQDPLLDLYVGFQPMQPVSF